VVDQHHREIANKTCAISAKDDKLETIKAYVSMQQSKGMNQDTVVTALADGAKIVGPSSLTSNPIARD